jgi:precorrin-6A/cobalt-precorrin-6A reductase
VRVLVLGGTGEARELAASLSIDGIEVLSSLAGRVREPRLPAGDVRIGGFGGAVGLSRFLREDHITALVDATHPFAATITDNAARAATETGVPRLVLRRAGWEPDPEWQAVDDIATAARAVRDWAGESVFLTTGRRDLAVFATDTNHEYLVRTVDPPDGAVPERMTLVLDRGPYTVERERELMIEHRIGLLVSKDSGGDMTSAKLAAARELGIPVVMVRRPPVPPGSTVVTTAAAARQWVHDHLARGTGAE